MLGKDFFFSSEVTGGYVFISVTFSQHGNGQMQALMVTNTSICHRLQLHVL